MENKILTATQWLRKHQWDKKYTNNHFQEILHLIELARKEGRNEGIEEALELAAEKATIIKAEIYHYDYNSSSKDFQIIVDKYSILNPEKTTDKMNLWN